MPFSPNKKLFLGILSKVAVLMLGVMILTVSVARAGWEIWASDENKEIPSSNIVDFTAVFSNGETSPGTYKYPKSKIKPDDAWYGMKKLRDLLWLSFSKGLTKVNLAVVQADKNMSDCIELRNEGKYDRAIEAGNEAMDKLEYADKLIYETQSVDAQTKQLHYQIFWAGYAYKTTLEKMENSFQSINTDKYPKLIKRIDDWNKKQEEKRYAWDF